MRTLPLALMAALAFAGAGVASAKDVKGCAAQWSALKKGGAKGSQTRAQFMTTCQAAGAPGGAPKPVGVNAAKPGA